MTDVKFKQIADIELGQAVQLDWLMTDLNLVADGLDLQSAVIVALGTDARADRDDVLPDPDNNDRGGWWGDMDAEEIWGAWPVGCRLWLLRRAKITGPLAAEGSTEQRADAYTREAMMPFVEHRIASKIDVTASRTDTGRIDVATTLYRGPEPDIELRYAELWAELGSTSMPWTTPTLKQVRILTRDFVTAALGAVTIIPNSVLRIMSDAMSGLAHLVLLYIDWLGKQMLPDTAEGEWLARHGAIWLKNSDGSVGKKSPAVSKGTVTMTTVTGTVEVPQYKQMSGPQGVFYQTMEAATVGTTATEVPVEALTGGTDGNLEAGDQLTILAPIPNLNGTATVVELTGGTDEETDDELRARVLFRIQQPPMGGDADDYIEWATDVPGVTRAWCAPLEMGVGTLTIRFMMDDLRASSGGFPNATDITTVTTYIDSKRPVAIKDRWILAPIPEPIDLIVSELDADTVEVRTSIEVAVREMLRQVAAPGRAVNGVYVNAQTIYASWVSEAILGVPGVKRFKLTMDDHVMPHNGALAVLGSIIYG